MAKAYANCTCKTCGKQFEYIVYGNNCREASGKAEWAEGQFDECENCYEARIQREREEANAAALKDAEAAGLPDLCGSEKQVAWANVIRQKAYEKVSAEIERRKAKIEKMDTDGNPKAERAKEGIKKEEAFSDFLFSHTSAHWWIDYRDELNPALTVSDMAYSLKRQFELWLAKQDAKETPEEAEIRKVAEAEMIVAPEKQTHSGVVKIIVKEREVCSEYEKDDDFRETVKRLGYSWDKERHLWNKAINFTTGIASERAAELGNNLLNGGFAVQIANPEIRTAAVNGDYEPEHHRWIQIYTSGAYKGWFCICLVRGDNMYDKAREIKGSQYVSPNVAVPPEKWMEVLDFADMYGYKTTPGVQRVVDAQNAAIVKVTPAPVKTVKYQEHDPSDVLSGSAEILEDLMDD